MRDRALFFVQKSYCKFGTVLRFQLGFDGMPASSILVAD